MPGPEPPPVCILPRYIEMFDSSGTSDNGGASPEAAPPATPPGVPRVTPCDGAIMTSCWELRNEVRAKIGEGMKKQKRPRAGVSFTLTAVPFAAHGVFVERGWLEQRPCKPASKVGVETVKLEALDSLQMEGFLAFHSPFGERQGGMGRALRRSLGSTWGGLAVCTRLVLAFTMVGRSHEDRRTKVKVTYDYCVVTSSLLVKFDTAMMKTHNIWALYGGGSHASVGGGSWSKSVCTGTP